ncbi:RodZ domain-containing protein [Gymnodinialimonas sp. 2305UL16-5]|uniref:helix-turn-helix domain-containing protein n=1 Tax=Gymnodinialimonas mytili TaxID=3126503 RepID=UPI0030AC65C6
MGHGAGNGWNEDVSGWDADTEHSDSAVDFAPQDTPPPAFDGYDLLDVPLGDLLRGERATLGKSLLDVERELRIRATYIAAIENGDVGAFQSQGFIAGYVRSYGRYLGIDPEWTFRRFCEETGFRGVHGGSAHQAAEVKRSIGDAPRRVHPNEVMSSTRISYAPVSDSVFSRIEPGALGSVAVLVVLALGIGYGAWAVLHDIQRLQIAPIDEAPAAPLAQLDPLEGMGQEFNPEQGFDIAMPNPQTADRLLRPQALEAPVLTPRDSAVGTLDPDSVGTLTAPQRTPQLAQADTDPESGNVQVTQPVDQVMIFATNPTWVQVTSSAGDTIFEATLNRGDSFVVPDGDGVPRLRSGNAGSLYFAVNGVAIGPAGVGASIARDVELTADAVSETFPLADMSDPDLIEVASAVFEAFAVPSGPVVVPEARENLVYDPTGRSSGDVQLTTPALFPDLPDDVAAAIIASNELPVQVSAPGPDDIRPVPRP